MKKYMSYIDQIKTAKKSTELYELLSKARKLEFISPKTLRKIEREGQHRLGQLTR